jgi:hypothetical protein
VMVSNSPALAFSVGFAFCANAFDMAMAAAMLRHSVETRGMG